MIFRSETASTGQHGISSHEAKSDSGMGTNTKLSIASKHNDPKRAKKDSEKSKSPKNLTAENPSNVSSPLERSKPPFPSPAVIIAHTSSAGSQLYTFY